MNKPPKGFKPKYMTMKDLPIIRQESVQLDGKTEVKSLVFKEDVEALIDNFLWGLEAERAEMAGMVDVIITSQQDVLQRFRGDYEDATKRSFGGKPVPIQEE